MDRMIKHHKEQGLDFDCVEYCKQLIGNFLDTALKAELETSLGYAKYGRLEKSMPNARNGFYAKTVRSSLGDITIHIPRDRSGKYRPIIVPKGVGCITDMEEKVLSIFNCGDSNIEIEQEIRALYGDSLPSEAIAQITEYICSEMEKGNLGKILDLY